MDLLEYTKFNKWTYFMTFLGYEIIGYQIEPFLIGIPIEIEIEKNDE